MATRDAIGPMAYAHTMRLPQVHSPYAVILMAAAITIVVWLIVIWPGTDTRQLPTPEPSITYVDMNMKDTQSPAPATPAPAPVPAPAP